MDDNSRDRLTLARRFLEPANSNHRQYEALRAFFVDGLPSAEVAARFGYTPGSFRVLVHQFRSQPERDFFISAPRQGRPPGNQDRLRDLVVALRKQNLSVHDISRALARDGESLSPAAVAVLLKREGYSIDIPAVIEAAAETGTWIEINAAPKRLDLDWRWWPLAKEKGVKAVINPDAHGVEKLQELWFGVGVARKGWLTRDDVMNCLPLGKIEAALRARSAAA